MLVLKARLTRKKETKFIMAVTTNFDETNMTLIRKSASLAGGYNRLSLERLSEDRLKMQAERERRKKGRHGNVVLRSNFKKVPKRKTM
ncbi:hypothetical protein V1478_002171 [Vespula squamosa]|uniref:Uncharacterized protein n=1 Tax=Vespula squamosa TaxID=30214 RepID=A0ABD2BVK7_VESSQ